jgi:hypothetical protein
MAVLGAWLGGLWRVCRAPWLVAIVYVLLLIVTLPLSARLHLELPEPARPFAVEPGAGPVPDFDWLDEVTANKRSLLGELTPAVIGVAAPLSNIDRLLDGDAPMFALLAGGVMLVAWAFLWGGVIATVATPRRPFFKACQESFSDVLAVNIGGLVLAVAIYGALRAILFTTVWPFVDGAAESTMLAWRIVLTIVPLIALTAVTLVFDYARIALVLGDATIPVAIGIGAKFVRANAIAVAVLTLCSVALFVALLVAYGAFEFIPGGSVPTLQRLLVLGQAYIAARIVLRLWNASAQVALFERFRTREARD